MNEYPYSSTGEAVYCDDLPVRHNELFLAFVLSTKAHARILSIDGSEALAMAGVRGIVTAADVPRPHRNEAPDFQHEEVFAIDTVRFHQSCQRVQPQLGTVHNLRDPF